MRARLRLQKWLGLLSGLSLVKIVPERTFLAFFCLRFCGRFSLNETKPAVLSWSPKAPPWRWPGERRRRWAVVAAPPPLGLPVSLREWDTKRFLGVRVLSCGGGGVGWFKGKEWAFLRQHIISSHSPVSSLRHIHVSKHEYDPNKSICLVGWLAKGKGSFQSSEMLDVSWIAQLCERFLLGSWPNWWLPGNRGKPNGMPKKIKGKPGVCLLGSRPSICFGHLESQKNLSRCQSPCPFPSKEKRIGGPKRRRATGKRDTSFRHWEARERGPQSSIWY